MSIVVQLLPEENMPGVLPLSGAYAVPWPYH